MGVQLYPEQETGTGDRYWRPLSLSQHGAALDLRLTFLTT